MTSKLSKLITPADAGACQQADQILSKWIEASAQLAQLREAEAILRSKLQSAFSPHAAEPLWRGTEHVALPGNEFELEFLYSNQYKVDFEEAQRCATKLAKPSLFRYKAELSLRDYGALTPRERKMVDKIVTVVPQKVQAKLKPLPAAQAQSAQQALRVIAGGQK